MTLVPGDRNFYDLKAAKQVGHAYHTVP